MSLTPSQSVLLSDKRKQMTPSSNDFSFRAKTTDNALRRVVAIVALANLAYFGVEFVVAQRIGSVSLFADSVDFLEDTSVNFLIVVALGWSVRNLAGVGMALAAILLIPTMALLWTAWQKFNTPSPPAPWLLSITGL
nr:cation transporter [Salinisphaera hydrothermalis]